MAMLNYLLNHDGPTDCLIANGGSTESFINPGSLCRLRKALVDVFKFIFTAILQFNLQFYYMRGIASLRVHLLGSTYTNKLIDNLHSVVIYLQQDQIFTLWRLY